METSTPTFNTNTAPTFGSNPTPSPSVSSSSSASTSPVSSNSNFDDPVIATQARNLTKAIFQQESGMNYNATGDAGTSKGAGQWQPATWKAQAKDVLGDENAPMTPENQSVVAQGTIRKLISQGKNAAQIAAIWNSGSDKNWENKVGTTTINGQQIKYNVPKYVKDVTDLYQQYKNQAPNVSTQAPQEQSLGQELSGRVNDLGQATGLVGKGLGDVLQGNVIPGLGHITSGVLQTGGALAGGLGDVVNKGLELIPGVKQVENLIGQGVGSLAQTQTGQDVVKAISDFSRDNPEISKDIGAGFNIVTAIPILKGLGVVKNIAGDAIANGLKGTIEKGFAEDLASSGGKAAQKLFNPQVVDTSIKYGVSPEIKNISGKVITDTTKAQQILEDEVSNIDKNVYQPALKGIDLKFPIEGVKNVANDIAVDNLSDPAPVNKILDRIAAKYGENPTLEQLNQAKRDISKKITENGFADPDLSNNRIARMALQKTIEQNALKFGAGNIADINKEMGNILKTINFYEKMDGMSLKQGLMHRGIKAVSTGVGAGIGGLLGNPVAGGALGYGASDLVEGQLTKLTPRAIRAGLVNRLGKNAVGVSKKQLLTKLPGLFAGAVNVK